MDFDTAAALDRAAAAVDEALAAFDADSHQVPASLRAAAATDVRLVPAVDLTRALILAGADAPDPARWLDLAITGGESFAALRPFATRVGIGGLGAQRASWLAVKRRGELLLWAGIARSLRGHHQQAVERLVEAAATFDFVNTGDGADPSTVRRLTGRAREEAAEAALAGGSRDAADELFGQAAMVYSAAGDEISAGAVERRRADMSTTVLARSGFLERSGTATATVLGTSSAVGLRQRAGDGRQPPGNSVPPGR